MLRQGGCALAQDTRLRAWSTGLLALGTVLMVHIARAAEPTTVPTQLPVTITARVDRRQITIGDRIRYTIEVSAAPETEVVIPVLSGQLGDFTISDFGEIPPRTENGRVIAGRWYTLTTFVTGDHLIPKPHVQYRTPGEGLRDAEGDEVLVGVTSLLAQTPAATDIRDIKPPEAVPFDWTPYLVVALVLAGVAGLGWLLFYVLNRPRRQPVVAPRPPHEAALAALNRLRTQRLIEAGRFGEYYIQLSAIVRTYLEDRFHLRAPEMTTEEFLSATAADTRLVAPHRRLLAEFLSQADLVKFAKHLPTLNDVETAYAAARRFVEETAPVAAPALAAEVTHAAA